MKSVEQPTRSLRGVMRVGLVAKGLLLKGDLDLELVLLCKDKPTINLLKKVSDNLGAQLKVWQLFGMPWYRQPVKTWSLNHMQVALYAAHFLLKHYWNPSCHCVASACVCAHTDDMFPIFHPFTFPPLSAHRRGEVRGHGQHPRCQHSHQELQGAAPHPHHPPDLACGPRGGREAGSRR